MNTLGTFGQGVSVHEKTECRVYVDDDQFKCYQSFSLPLYTDCHICTNVSVSTEIKGSQINYVNMYLK